MVKKSQNLVNVVCESPLSWFRNIIVDGGLVFYRLFLDSPLRNNNNQLQLLCIKQL